MVSLVKLHRTRTRVILMKTNAAAYWIALGVLALGLNSEYRQGKFVTAHRIAERTASTLCRITTRAEKTLAVAMGSTGHQGLTVDPFVPFTNEAETVREQSKLMRELARNKSEFLRDEIRVQADAERAKVEQIGWPSNIRLASTGNRSLVVVCPKIGARVVGGRIVGRQGIAGSESATVSPSVAVETSF